MKGAVAIVIALALVLPASVDSARPPQLLSFSITHWQPGKQVLQRGGICLAKANGTNAVRFLTSPSDRDADFGAAWSPDGRYVAFARWFVRDRLTDVLVANARGRVLRNLNRRDGNGLFETDPSWSPDGRRLVFAKSWRGTNIWFVNRDGSGLDEFLVDDTAQPAWSPAGEKIAFTVGRADIPGPPTAIHTISPDGTDRRAILPGAADPSWSPDGRKVAFVSFQSTPRTEIAVANADGSERRNLTATSAPELAPAWSPDGRYIAFERGRERRSIVVVDAKTGAERWIIRRKYGVHSPSWRAQVHLPRAKRPPCR